MASKTDWLAGWPSGLFFLSRMRAVRLAMQITRDRIPTAFACVALTAAAASNALNSLSLNCEWEMDGRVEAFWNCSFLISIVNRQYSLDSIAPDWFETLLARSPKSEECLSVFRFEHELMRNCKDTKMQKQAQIDAFALSWTPFTRQRLDVNAISPHLHLPPLSLPYRTNPSARIACSQWQSLQRGKI